MSDVGGRSRHRALAALALAGLLAGASAARATPDSTTAAARAPDTTRVYLLPGVEVWDTHPGALGPRATASEGWVRPEQVAIRPLLRVGDVLESVPGLLVSQHSGEGKANQYYLRGFNLDHGTDFATSVDGVPVNMPSHAHGQGYTDLNFLLPELIGGVLYRKGPYSVEDGDFSSAGSAHIAYRDTLPRPLLSLTAGDDGYRRAFAAASTPVGPGRALGALERVHDDGPWAHPDGYRKTSGLVRYGQGGAERGVSVTATGYDGRWNSTDQVPARAVASGRLSRFGTVDPTDGGRSSRWALSSEFHDVTDESVTRVSAYVLAYRLDLFSDFTYFLSDSVHGDQIEQADDRIVAGLGFRHTFVDRSGGAEARQTIGVDVRHDRIGHLGLYRTEARRRLSTIREDHVLESSVAPFVQSDTQWLPFLRTVLGVRAELHRFSVASGYAPYSGSGVEEMVSPKASVVLGPWSGLELFVNGGHGFHSSDARGARFDASGSTNASAAELREAADHFPIPGAPPIGRSPLLVRTRGAEVGARLDGGPRGSVSATLWGLDIDAENVFLGDAGFSSPSRPSRRVGIELTGEARLWRRLRVSGDYARSRARFRDHDPAGDLIPGAVDGVATANAEYTSPAGAFGALRLRYFGPRPLVEDGSARSPVSTTLDAELGRRAAGPWSVVLQVFNVLDAEASDIDYFYVSRLPGEPVEGVPDLHFHPQAPRSFRIVVSTGPRP